MSEPYYAPDEMWTGVEPDRRRVWPWVVAAVVVVALAAGGAVVALGGDSKPTPAAASTPSAPAPAAATVAPSPSNDGTLKLGQLFAFKDGSTQVLRYKQPVGSTDDITSAIEADVLEKGGTFGSIEVRTCVAKTSKKAYSVSSGPWSLEFSDGTVQEEKITGPTPGTGYSFFGKTVRPGKCMRGWITFPIPPKVRPTVAVYESDGNVGEPAEWRLA